MENNFEYKVSVIVPVYNVEEYLRGCLNSLINQTIDADQMEVIMINDGSTDNSLSICLEYSDIYSNFKTYTKENEGLSATRNYGILRANGKYLFFLDSDDTFTPETCKEVSDFFEKHYEETDLVTFLDQPYRNGKKEKPHYRYKILKKSGVYSLEDYPYIAQTRVSICVKNMPGNNYMFDTTPGFRQEDQEYCSKILKEKDKIGFCDKGEYSYNRSNAGSIVSNNFHAYYLFEPSMAYFERLFSEFEGEVPVYYQAMFINDLIWKHNENKLYPYHYSPENFEIAMNRIKNLLDRVDVETIVNHPQLDNFQKPYWLMMKRNCRPSVVANKNKIEVLYDKKVIYSRVNFEIIMHKIRINDKHLHFMGFIKSPLYTYCLGEKAKIFVVENGDIDNKMPLEVFTSVHSYYRSNTKTCDFWAFSYHCDTRAVKEFYFVVEFDGILYETRYWCMPIAVFNDTFNSYVRDNVKISLNVNKILLEQLDAEAVENFELEQTEKFKNKVEIYNLRKRSLIYRKQHHVWLYYDMYTVEKDNGYYQFINDFSHDDGIERYYIYSKELKEIEHLFSEEQRKNLIKYGSIEHKLLYISSEKILTAFYGFSTISPFKDENEEGDYIDIEKFQVIYLQHGILHADLLLKNHAERCRADKIVVSSMFEKNNYMTKYAYEEQDLICTGMARYDHIDRERKAKNRILFAPSWREYLTIVQSGSKWDVQYNRIKESDYYKKFMQLMESPQLMKLLKKYDLHFDFKAHPIISSAAGLFNVENERIHLAPASVDIEDYCLFITDISSYVYDFAYLNRPIIYFMPDMDQFKSGMNHYRNLDLDWKDGFGNLYEDADAVIKEIEHIARRNFKPENQYQERMDDFYFPLINCAEKLYQFLYLNVKI